MMTIYINLYMMTMVITTAIMGMTTIYGACMYVCVFGYVYIRSMYKCTYVRVYVCIHVCMDTHSPQPKREEQTHTFGETCQSYPLLTTPPTSADHDCPWPPTDLQLTRLQINLRCSPRSKLIEHLRFTVFATSLLCCVRGSTPLPLAELFQQVPLFLCY